MQGTVLTWTRIDRPPPGFAAGRVLLLVQPEQGPRVYALWSGEKEPAIGDRVRVDPLPHGGFAAAPAPA